VCGEQHEADNQRQHNNRSPPSAPHRVTRPRACLPEHAAHQPRLERYHPDTARAHVEPCRSTASRNLICTSTRRAFPACRCTNPCASLLHNYLFSGTRCRLTVAPPSSPSESESPIFLYLRRQIPYNSSTRKTSCFRKCHHKLRIFPGKRFPPSPPSPPALEGGDGIEVQLSCPVTGDGPATARVIARQVGVGDRVWGRETV
jgi:hypothetical protein